MRSIITKSIVAIMLLLNQNVSYSQDLTVDVSEVEGVTMSLENTDTGEVTTSTTNEFNDVADGDYSLTAEKDTMYMEGVSTLDILLIQRHILQLKKFTDPYDYFAADVKSDASINALDIIQLRRLILGKIDELPNNTSWRFGDPNQTFSSDLSTVLASGLDEDISITMDGNDVMKSFVPIKIGDVNNTVLTLNGEEPIDESLLVDINNIISYDHKKVNQSSISRTSDTVHFNIENINLIGQTSVCVPITIENFIGITGFQFPISWDTNVLQLTTTDRALSDIYQNETHEGELFVLWTHSIAGTEDLEDGSTLIELCFDIIDPNISCTNIYFPIVMEFGKLVFGPDDNLPSSFNGGEICSVPTCLSGVEVVLDYSNEVEVFGDILYYGETVDDVILVNGEESITFDCSSIGENTVEVTVTSANGDVNICSIPVLVLDENSPIINTVSSLEVTLGSDLNYVLDPSEVDDSSYDECSTITLSVSPAIITCDMDNPVKVTLTGVDEYGNSSSDYTWVDLLYPAPVDSVVYCYNEISVIVSEGNTTVVTPSMAISANLTTCADYYVVTLSDEDGSNTQPDNLLDSSDAGNTYLYTVTEPVSGQSCSGLLQVNDATYAACAFRPIGDAIQGVTMISGYDTNETGCVDLGALAIGTEITPTKEDDQLEGVDILDYILLLKGILNMEELTPYQLIAADINNDGHISTLDALLLDKMFLGEYDLTTPVWKFVEASHNFGTVDINDIPQEYPNSIELNEDVNGNHFIGMKMGDINYSYNQNITSSNNPSTYMVITDEILNEGELYRFFLKSSTVHALEGIQFTMDYNESQLEIGSITSNVLPGFSMEDHVVIEDGKITVSYIINKDEIFAGGVEILSNTVLLDINCEAVANGILSENIELLSTELNILKSQEESKPYNLDIEWENKIVNSVVDKNLNSVIGFYPQPATDYVNVTWNKEQLQHVNYTIMNAIGQVVTKANLVNDQINVSNLNTGLYMVRMYKGTDLIAINKLVVTK